MSHSLAPENTSSSMEVDLVSTVKHEVLQFGRYYEIPVGRSLDHVCDIFAYMQMKLSEDSRFLEDVLIYFHDPIKKVPNKINIDHYCTPRYPDELKMNFSKYLLLINAALKEALFTKGLMNAAKRIFVRSEYGIISKEGIESDANQPVIQILESEIRNKPFYSIILPRRS